MIRWLVLGSLLAVTCAAEDTIGRLPLVKIQQGTELCATCQSQLRAGKTFILTGS